MIIQEKDIGRLVQVRGCSQKGINLIHQHGQIWRIKKVWANQILLEGTVNEGTTLQGLRWVFINDDREFEIVEFLGGI